MTDELLCARCSVASVLTCHVEVAREGVCDALVYGSWFGLGGGGSDGCRGVSMGGGRGGGTDRVTRRQGG